MAELLLSYSPAPEEVLEFGPAESFGQPATILKRNKQTKHVTIIFFIVIGPSKTQIELLEFSLFGKQVVTSTGI
jgi:hypothetical protein